jgi:hypothetical protein
MRPYRLKQGAATGEPGFDGTIRKGVNFEDFKQSTFAQRRKTWINAPIGAKSSLATIRRSVRCSEAHLRQHRPDGGPRVLFSDIASMDRSELLQAGKFLQEEARKLKV